MAKVFGVLSNGSSWQKVLEIPGFEDCTKAYRRWLWGITEFFRVPYSNGFTEGKNNKI